MSKHTPTPYTIAQFNDEDGNGVIQLQQDHSCAVIAERIIPVESSALMVKQAIKDMDFLASACNSHDELVEQMKSMVTAWKEGRLNQDHITTAEDILRRAGQ